MTSAPSLVEALVVVTSSTAVAGRSQAFRIINQALREPWFESRLLATTPRGTDVDDVRQRVLVSLLGASRSSNPRRAFEGTTPEQAHAFLITIARRRAIETIRMTRNETKLADGSLQRVPDVRGPYHDLIERDLWKRLDELIGLAGKIQTSPDATTLRRHINAVLIGMSAADARPGSDLRVRARLRKERSRSLDLLRRALAQAIDEGGETRPDELDRIIERLLETPKSSNTLEE